MNDAGRQTARTLRRNVRRSRQKALAGALAVLVLVVVTGTVLVAQSGVDRLPFRLAVVGLLALLLGTATHRLLRRPDRLREQVRARTVALEAALDEARRGKQQLAAITEHLQGVLQSSPDAVIAGAGAGIITEWNTAAERLYGWSRREMVGARVSRLVPPGESSVVEEADGQEGSPSTIRTVVPRLRKDGSVFQAELTFSIFRDDAGRIRTWVAVVRDVTHELLVSQARDAVRQAFQPAAAVASLVDALADICPATVASLVEPVGSTAKRHACLSGTGEVLAPPEHLVPSESIAGRALVADGPVLEIGARADRALGHVRAPWRVAVPLRRSAEAAAVLVLGGEGPAPTPRALEILDRVGSAVAQDVVNVLLYERQRETTDRLYELDQLKSDFLSSVSHELRTPLTAIAGFASTLDDHWDDLPTTMRRNFVRRIVQRSKALDDLVRQLLDYSRLGQRPLDVETVPCELAREVRREVGALEHVLREHDVEVDVPEDLLVDADPAALCRIVQNLLTNAAKFSPAGTTIRVDAERSKDDVVVRVSDEGIGISPQEHERIFQRFYRVNRGDRVRAGGTGIGLALVKEYVEALGGRVWVQSEPGAGSTFLFTLCRPESAVEVAEPADDRRPDGREHASGSDAAAR